MPVERVGVAALLIGDIGQPSSGKNSGKNPPHALGELLLTP